MTVELLADPVQDLRHAVERLLETDMAEMSLADLEQCIPEFHVLKQRLDAAALRALASYDARGGAQLAGHRTTGAWLARRTHMNAGQAGALVHTARALRDDLPRSAEALADGSISMDHVGVVRWAHRRIPRLVKAAEEQIVGVAKQHDPATTRRFVDRLVQQYQPDKHDDDAEAARERRWVHCTPRSDGWARLDGLLDPATAAQLTAALDAFAAPAGDDDRRSAPQRTCDALAEIAAIACSGVERVSGMGRINVTVTADQLWSGLGGVWPTGLLMSRTDLQELSCTAEVSLVVGVPIDGVRWQPLAVGLSERFATKAQRAALAVRDGRGCVHPGCTVPAHRCVAHHIVHWADGGPTDVENMVLLCPFHHRRVHVGRLDLVQRDDGSWCTQALRAPP